MKIFGFVLALAIFTMPAMALTAKNGPIWSDCTDVKLQQAAGVPGAGDHTYKLAGVCKHVSTHYVDGKKEGVTEYGRAFLDIRAQWDASKNTLSETAKLSGDEGGSVSTILRCSDDPYIMPTTCNVTAHSNETAWPDLSHWATQKQRPIGASHTTLSDAAAKSASGSATPPPPPPPAASAPPQTTTGKSFRKVKEADSDGVDVSTVNVMVLQRSNVESITATTAELLQGATSTGPSPSMQAMTAFGEGWADGDQLFWPASAVGQKLDVQITAEKTGRYQVVASFTTASDFGIVQAFVNGQAVGDVVNLYSKAVERTGPRVLGTVNVKAGLNTLVLWAVGKDQRSRGHFAGLDQVELIPAP